MTESALVQTPNLPASGKGEASPVLLKVFDAKETLSTPKRHHILSANLTLRCFMAVPLAEIASGEKRKELAEHFGEAVKVRDRAEVESILEGISESAVYGVPAIPGIVARLRLESDPRGNGHRRGGDKYPGRHWLRFGADAH